MRVPAHLLGQGLIAVVLVAVLCAASDAREHVVLNALPTVRVDSGEGGTKRSVLAKSERTKSAVTIVRRGDQFFWASRENVELLHDGSGAVHYFVAPQGSGYIKVLDTKDLPESMRRPGPRFSYMEHVSMELVSITYWGATDEFNLGDGPSDGGK